MTQAKHTPGPWAADKQLDRTAYNIFTGGFASAMCVISTMENAHRSTSSAEVAAVDSDEKNEGGVIDHNHHSSYQDCVDWLANNPIPDGVRYEVVLVCDVDECRGWAYLTGGALPEKFHNANGVEFRKVPKKFHAEVVKATGSAA